MTEEQKLRYELIRNTNSVEQAREFYDFIMGETKIPVINVNCQYEDGIYLCYEDGYKKPFPSDEVTLKHGHVTHIGIKVGEHMVGLSLNSLGEQSLPYNSELEDDGFEYKRQELHALDDFDGKANTDHLKRHGEFEFDLADDEWIPSLGELAIIFKNKDKLNEALASVGGDELVDDWYWSSTEYNAGNAWYVNFSNGSVISYPKFNSFVVRPVCAF